MKKWKMILPMFALVLACTACGGNEDKPEEKTEKDVVAEQPEDENVDEKEASVEGSRTYTLVSETEDVSIKISIPGEYQETEYSSESWLALEIPGDDADSSTQLMMYLEADTSVDVKETMLEEVNYLMSANSDDWEEIDYVEGVSADYHEWAYITYELDGLKGYKLWCGLKNGTVLAGTVELIGDSPKAFDISEFIHEIDKTIVAD